jgi:hypothetical protein
MKYIINLTIYFLLIISNFCFSSEPKLTKIVCSGSVKTFVLDTRPQFLDGNGSKSKETFFSAQIIEQRVIVDEKEDPKNFPGGLKIGSVNLDSSELGFRILQDCAITGRSINCAKTIRTNREGTFITSGSSQQEKKLPHLEMQLSEIPVSKALESLSKERLEIDRQTGILDTYSDREIKLSERIDGQLPFSARITYTGRFQCELAPDKSKF